MIILGISGKKRTGKNTVASLIKVRTNLIVQEFAFAQDLKLELAQMLKIKVSDIENNKGLYRNLLQALGVYRREFNGHNYWIDKTLRKVYYSNADICIITDVRFQNEVEAVKACGGIVVRVCRDTGAVDTHESETALDNYNQFDAVLLNTSTLEHLSSDVLELMKKLNIKTK